MAEKQQSSLRDRMPFIVGLIVLMILLVVCTYYFIKAVGAGFGVASAGAGNDIFTEGVGDSGAVAYNASKQSSVLECLLEKGIDRVIFLYSPTCPHCLRMQPVIDQLIAEGYDISKVSVQETGRLSAISSCVKIRPVVPQLICHKSGAVLEGEAAISKVREFYNKCNP